MARTRSALIVGLGIAGMAAAKRLQETGWEVTIVERSAQRRTGGYFIALFGTGAKSAQRMGLLDALPTRARRGAQTWEIDRGGAKRPGMSFASVPDAPRMLLRGDVENALHDALPEEVEVRFGTTPTAIQQYASGVEVTLRDSHGVERSDRYDLLLGADGIRSTVRRLAFGPDSEFVRPLDYMIAATLLDEEVTGVAPGDSIILSEPGRSATTFAFADRPPSLLLSYRTDDPAGELAKRPIDALRAAYGPEPTGPVLGELLDRYEAAEHSLFDVAQQVRMDRWHRGRIALIGDAAWCMTLYSGLGASSGIAGAELLGTVLAEHEDDVAAALADWNTRMHPFIDYQHQAIDASRAVFVSAHQREHLRRAAMMRMMSVPGVSSLMSKAMMRNKGFAMKAVDVGAAPAA